MPQMKMSVRPKDVPYMVEEWKMRKKEHGIFNCGRFFNRKPISLSIAGAEIKKRIYFIYHFCEVFINFDLFYVIFLPSVYN